MRSSGQWWRPGGRIPRTRAPLLDQHQVLELRQRVFDRRGSLEHEREVAHRLIGDARSVYRGTGLDYEESRPYELGDELRFMNWRLTARTGQLHVKVFREERRPGVFVLVDRRSPMRFGSRVRLKATQAARAAGIAAFSAQLRNMPVGGVILDPGTQWLPSAPGEASALNLMAAAAAPCPPLDAADDAVSLGHVIKLLQNMLTRGTVVYLISDFLDLHETDRASLVGLAQEHQVCAVHIVDPIEMELPHAGKVRLRASPSAEPFNLDTDDAQLRRRYARTAQQHLAQRRQMFVAQGIPYVRLSTDTEPVENDVPVF